MRVAFHTLGCKVNQYETEAVKEAFVSRGAEIVSEDDCADVYIVNTCTVTNIADRKSRQYIRRMKGVNSDALIVVTGCYAQVESEEIAAMPEVDLIIGNGLKSTICDEVYRLLAKTGARTCKTAEIKRIDRSDLNYYEDMGTVVSAESGKTRAYIKIQEGCDRFCAYCLIPFARGPVRSRPPEEIVREAAVLLDSGHKEIVLTGINTALYGTEKHFRYRLRDAEGHVIPGLEEFSAMTADRFAEIAPIELILAELNAMAGDFRIRLSSLEPTVVDKNDVERIIKYDRLCGHLHLSAQSGSTAVLRLMNRRYTQRDYLDIVKAIRDYDPLYGITTDIIVGFSGETEADFDESLKVVREAQFGKVHVFRYSPRKGTVGEKLPDEVPGPVKNRRADELSELAAKTSEAFIEMNRGHVHTVLTEERCDGYVMGYTGNYIKTYIKDEDEKLPLGEFCDVRILGAFRDGAEAFAV